MSSFDPVTGSIVVPTQAVLGLVPAQFPSQIPITTADQAGLSVNGLRDADNNNVAPRFGFAFRPFSGTRTVIRGGYGIYYDDFTSDLANGFLVSRGPFDFSEGFTNSIPSGVPLLTLQNPFLDQGSLGLINVGGLATDVANPYMQQWNFTVDQEIGHKIALHLTYLGTKTTGLVHRRDINKPPASTIPFDTSRRFYPLYREIRFGENGGSQSYNALIVRADRRMAGGLVFQMSYTLAKNLTDVDETAGVESGSFIEDPFNRARERGNATYTARHRLVASAMWDLPFGKGGVF